MDLENIRSIEKATRFSRNELFRVGTALVFIAAIMLYTRTLDVDPAGLVMLVTAAMIGGYMALNIGANDVANNVGPAVGSQALTMTGAILIAAVFEAGGALIAGGDVVGTIKSGIIDPAQVRDTETFIWLMTAALLAGAIWLNLATALGAPVSTTHSIVGGVLGAGIAAGGFGIADWNQFMRIAASWVVSPVMGGVIAAAFLYAVKRGITYQSDMVAAARRQVPVLVGLMAWAFSTYLLMKGLGKVVEVGFVAALAAGLVIGVLLMLLARRLVSEDNLELENSKASIDTLFTAPLIFAAALLSFAHGANDVANAVGPLAAVHDAVAHGAFASQAAVPIWVMVVGALGLALGLALYGPRLIKTVGSGITELDRMRAYCIAMAAAITVIIASALGLPVSSTHTAVGGVLGVGFLREYLKVTYRTIIDEIEAHHAGEDREVVESFLERFHAASFQEKGYMLKVLKSKRTTSPISKAERKRLKRAYRQELVKRTAVVKIVAAWVITVPASGLMAAVLYFTIRGMFLP